MSEPCILSQKHLTDPQFGQPPEKQNEILQKLGAPHVSSFNYMLREGLDQAVADLTPVEFKLNDTKICLSIDDAKILQPCVPYGTVGVKDSRIFPAECRQRAASYKGKLVVTVRWSANEKSQTFQKDMGEVPIMLRSDACNLKGLSPAELVKRGEHEQEWGGYFIVKGHERIVRMLMMTRRNYPLTIRRPAWKMRRPFYTDLGVQIRCVTEDQTATTNVLHFVTGGTAELMFSYRKQLYYIPLMLLIKCLCDYPDYYIYQQLTAGFDDKSYLDRVQDMFVSFAENKELFSQESSKNYLGMRFRMVFGRKISECPEWATNIELADFLIKKCILIHLKTNIDKFNLLIFMTQKLFYFAHNKCRSEGADSVIVQEVLLGGHLFLQIIKEKLQFWLNIMKLELIKRVKSESHKLVALDFSNAARFSGTMGKPMEMFIATGSLISETGLGLMQDKGLTIMPENINRMRYMSHFKSVHRGSFFQEMRTTDVRQLLPDAWGFICPVHTPDGAPCGLLNHLTVNCHITDVPDSKMVAKIPTVLSELGMLLINDIIEVDFSNAYNVLLDGRMLGYIQHSKAQKFVAQIRHLKIYGKELPNMMEIVLIPKKKITQQFPGLFLFTGPARMVRPVLHLPTGKIEYIGAMEQAYLNICVTPEGAVQGSTTHMEISRLDFMSNLAKLIPLPDCNQSPRNMYQCQMGKQTMGTPCHNWRLQAETKLYRLQTPHSPFYRTKHYDDLQLDEFAMGTNAIVAVISNTSYDMEDAMIINRAADERGLAHASIYKSEFIELDTANSFFCRDPQNASLVDYLDTDGLPFIGRKMEPGQPLYSFYNSDLGQYLVKKFKGKEDCYVDSVRLCGNSEKGNRLACLTYRIPRNPNVGDKFASRAGQKGICSRRYNVEDLPFSESGMIPDIVFNPHGFPSRMTIAMMVELMAGKSAAIHGVVHDATPFRFTEDDTAVHYFGRLLKIGGYSYQGTETMYSGVDGCEIIAEIFFGVVHYQRLRHMVSDKWQVRSTGPFDIMTRQPIKGRKKGGGVRFGEMERDGLISHGAAHLLEDRLLHCSDQMSTYICTRCNMLISTVSEISTVSSKSNVTECRNKCRLCDSEAYIKKIDFPYISKYVVTDLAGLNLNFNIHCEEV